MAQLPGVDDPYWSGANDVLKAVVARDKSALAISLHNDKSGVNAVYKARNYHTPLSVAVDGGDAGIVKQLVDAGASVNFAVGEQGLTPLMIAITASIEIAPEQYDDNLETIKTLVRAGARVRQENRHGGTPIVMARLIYNNFKFRTNTSDALREHLMSIVRYLDAIPLSDSRGPRVHETGHNQDWHAISWSAGRPASSPFAFFNAHAHAVHGDVGSKTEVTPDEPGITEGH